MSSREQLLAAVAKNQPEAVPLPGDLSFGIGEESPAAMFTRIATGIGSKIVEVKGADDIRAYILEQFKDAKRIVSTLPELAGLAENIPVTDTDPHTFEDIDLAILKPHFAVAENGACWITEDLMGQRVIPFICQHLAFIVEKDNIVPTLHQAYEIIGNAEYGYAAFIAGPSKTADIEQSLVLGAHGPRSMTVFLV